MCLNTVAGTCYRKPHQEEVEPFFRQLEEALRVQALIHKGSTLSTLVSSESAQAIQEISALRNALPDTGDQGAAEGNCSAGPDPYKQGRTGQECEVQGQSWLQLPQEGRTQDPQIKEQSKKQDHNPGQQEGLLQVYQQQKKYLWFCC